MRCPVCGSEVGENQKYCVSCGRKLSSEGPDVDNQYEDDFEPPLPVRVYYIDPVTGQQREKTLTRLKDIEAFHRGEWKLEDSMGREEGEKLGIRDGSFSHFPEKVGKGTVPDSQFSQRKRPPRQQRMLMLLEFLVIAVLVIIPVGAIVLFLFGGLAAKPEVYTDVAHYREYMSFGAENSDSKWSKWGMDEEIWPGEISDSMNVADFKMVYYDPFDKQYLGYLVVDYTEKDYAAEVERLKAYPSTEYVGYYGVREETTYELLAVNADSYQGFVYALTDGQGRIIYAEQIFCNYFMDLDYSRYIPVEYLLDGFDATQENDYMKQMMRSGN